MIATTFEDVFAPGWVASNINDQAHELVILRKIIPWQKIIDELVSFYDKKKGRPGFLSGLLSLFF